MKKLNASEVSNVVGGTLSNCKVSYKMDKMNIGSLVDVSICSKVNTCEGKMGEPVVTSVPVALSNCAA